MKLKKRKKKALEKATKILVRRMLLAERSFGVLLEFVQAVDKGGGVVAAADTPTGPAPRLALESGSAGLCQAYLAACRIVGVAPTTRKPSAED